MIKILVLLLASLSGTVGTPVQESVQVEPDQEISFESQVDMAPFNEVAVWDGGRIKSWESFSRSMMQFVSGSRKIDGQSPAFTYLDMALRSGAYENRDIIFVKKKPMRAAIIRALVDGDRPESATDERLETFMQSGLIAKEFILSPGVVELLASMQGDVMRFAKPIEAIQTAVGVGQPQVLRRSMMMVPPTGPDALNQPWTGLDELSGLAPGDEISSAWLDLQSAWVAEDAPAVNKSMVTLANLLQLRNPEIYPSAERLQWESFYFQWSHLTWVWIIYLFSIALLLMWLVYKWRGAFWLGMTIFGLGFIGQTVAVLLRWYVADRFPNTNMFEAVTTSAWFAAIFALIMEFFVRRTRMSGIFALASAICSMVAMMATRLYPLELSAGISNKMPVLHDIWLYIHTNVIIFSYALIFLAAVSALLYMLWRLVSRNGKGVDAWARAGGAGFLIVPRAGGQPGLVSTRTGFGHVLDGTTMILVELSFILLWAGLVMGAIWADHSWGRPWGWDPKEVFALNTFIIYALLIHVRMKVKDKGMWTAVLAIIGCAVMLFNWIIINFTISGLHSYA
ncbi:MAG: hypothetical protein CMJ40_08850 [Phycisphaerae bacterium]|nr:hypothetical protein [Phycisphaerae bacterium]